MHLTKPISTLFILLLFSLCQGVLAPSAEALEIPLETPIEAYQTTSDKVIITVTIEMGEEWYTYSDVPGKMGKPTKLTGTTANGKSILTVYPKGISRPDAYDPSVKVNKFLNGTILYIPLPTDSELPLLLQLDLLLCHPTKCVPVRRELTFGDNTINFSTLPLAEDQPWWDEYEKLSPSEQTGTSDQIDSAQYTEWNFTPRYLKPGLEVGSLFSAILMGLLAGLILNIMPCVLPVISLKLSAILNSSTIDNEIDRIHAFREHNLFFVLGILAFFTFLAIILGVTGQAWGALFQQSWLVLGMAVVILGLSMSLFGLFHLPIIDLKFGTDNNNPRAQAFFTGNLTTLLATPCSGPFLGGVLSWALVQGPIVIATVFISIGLGMSLPYLLLIVNPSFSRFLPKSGPWIEYVEKGIAFFLVATAFYLASIALGAESLRILAPLWVILLGGWLWKRTNIDISTTRRWGIRLTSIVLLAAAIVWTTPPSVPEQTWEKFDVVDFKNSLGKDAMFVDFTAEWCPTCKALDATVLTAENIARWKSDYPIRFIKVDLTERSVEGEALLKALGSYSIPAAALFTPDNPNSPLVLRDIFTQTQLENVLESWEK